MIAHRVRLVKYWDKDCCMIGRQKTGTYILGIWIFFMIQSEITIFGLSRGVVYADDANDQE